MSFKANLSGVTVKRVKDGFQVCGTVTIGRIEQPVCVVVKDSAIKRALRDVKAEGTRFARRVASWFFALRK